MALGIGQQIKGMVNRARSYWSELTDGAAARGKSGRDDVEDAVHQRYGGERGTDTEMRQRERQQNAQDQGRADSVIANSAARTARGEQQGAAGGSQLGGGQGSASPQMQADSQTRRQYTQQGGSGIQKTLNEQLGGSTDKASGSGADRPSSGQRR